MKNVLMFCLTNSPEQKNINFIIRGYFRLKTCKISHLESERRQKPVISGHLCVNIFHPSALPKICPQTSTWSDSWNSDFLNKLIILLNVHIALLGQTNIHMHLRGFAHFMNMLKVHKEKFNLKRKIFTISYCFDFVYMWRTLPPF